MKIATKILLAFSLILLLSILDTLSNYILSIKVEENRKFLNDSQEIIRKSGQFQRLILEMQSSFRGFLLTEDSFYLDGYQLGSTTVPHIISDLKEYLKDNPAQEKLLDTISALHGQWVSYAQKIIDTKRQNVKYGSGNDYEKLVESSFRKQVGKKLNNQINERFTKLNNMEYDQRQIHFDNLTSSIRKTHLFSWSFFSLTVFIGILATFLVMRFISRRIKSMVKLAENISKGNFVRIEDKYNDELTSLSTSMNVMSANLEKSITQLEARNTELDKFAYVVSHDLKAPLRGIYNVIKWIQEDIGNEVSSVMAEYLTIISKRAERMELLINGLLEYARLRIKAPAESTDVNAMVIDLVNELVPKTYDVTIKNLPVIQTERLKLERVLSNLISNAVKFTPPDQGRIEISAIALNGYHEFTVKDNGIGIDQAYHHKIFEIFQTLREKEDEESTGIGLSIVKKILDEHHEQISVTSLPGEGSAFTFTWHIHKK